MQLDINMIPYVLSQLDVAKDDLDGAKYLIDGGKYRIALNRVYYCIFHTLKALAVLHNENFSKHSGYISYFQREYIKTEVFDRELSKIVTRAKTLRESSDYGDMAVVSKETAVNDYNDACSFYEKLSQFIKKEIAELNK